MNHNYYKCTECGFTAQGFEAFLGAHDCPGEYVNLGPRPWEERDEYPENKAVVTWEEEEAIFSLVYHDDLGHYCGYCRFPKRPLIEQRYRGLVTYVPVHGGITYAEESEDGSMVYGFDCAHSGDEDNPNLRDLGWLKAECKRMADSLQVMVAFEAGYLLAPSNEAKAKVIDQYHETLSAEGIHFDIRDNFGAMLHLIAGDL